MSESGGHIFKRCIWGYVILCARITCSLIYHIYYNIYTLVQGNRIKHWLTDLDSLCFMQVPATFLAQARYPWGISFRKAHSPKTAFSRDAATLFQGGRKFKPIDKEPDNVTWTMRQGWGTSLRLGFLAVQTKSSSYVMWFCITPVKYKILR